MMIEIAKGVSVPFLGTSLGAMCVFFLKKELSHKMQGALIGFAAGVMTAASIWSLLLPAIEQAETMGTWKFIPAAAGFWIGILFLILIDRLFPQENIPPEKVWAGTKAFCTCQLSENPVAANGDRCFRKNNRLLLAVTLHNIPEGMAVGVIYAGLLNRAGSITALGAFSLALGIAVQNFPEGAIISMPLRAAGTSKRRAFLLGVFSGAVEPVAAVLTIWAASLVVPVLPWLLSFAAGAMIYVVVEELIPQMAGASAGENTSVGILLFTAGFTVMLILDVALG